jgi:ADP-ribosyl-[dinitrogen reductase] hydrolase
MVRHASATLKKRFEGCIVGGAIGDAWGSAYEHLKDTSDSTTFYLNTPKKPVYNWAITDDTQLTLATCEAIAESKLLTPEMLAAKLLSCYKAKKFSGLGASTLKALGELEVGGHWSLVGRTGEYAAGNGAAMRIAPFAFKKTFSRNDIRDFCRITHKNDEAYAGALAVVLSIRAVISNTWNSDNNLLEIIIPEIPDTRVRDRLIEIVSCDNASIREIAKLGVSGYVVDSVPFAIFAASQIVRYDFETVIREVIESGGDTDTNASIAGQIAGSIIMIDMIPAHLSKKIADLKEYAWIRQATDIMKHQLDDE